MNCVWEIPQGIELVLFENTLRNEVGEFPAGSALNNDWFPRLSNI